MPRSLGDFHALGAYFDDPYFIGPVAPPELSYPLDPNKDGDYQGNDEDLSPDAKEILKTIAFWSPILSGVGDLTKNFLKSYADAKLANDLNSAKGKMDQARSGMADYGGRIGADMGNIGQSNENLGSLGNTLFDLGNGISSQLSALSNISQSIGSLNTQLSQQTMALEGAQRRLDQAMARTDLSLGEKRSEIKSANADVRDKNLAVNDTSFQISSMTDSYNLVGSQLTQNIQTANIVKSDLATEYAQNQKFREALKADVKGYNQSAEAFSSAMGDARDAVNSYKDFGNNVLMPIAEGSAGIRGLGKISGAVADGKYGEASGIALSSGFDAYVRNGGSQLGAVQGLVGGSLVGIGMGIDDTIKSGGDIGDFIVNASSRVGQATLRTNDMMKVADGFDVAYTVLNNQANPNRVYDSAQIMIQQMGPSASIVGTWMTTASSLIPGINAISPAVGVVSKVLPATAQGATAIAVETVNKVATSGFSGTVGDYPTRPIGRGLVVRESGGTASALTIMGAGGVATAINAGKSVTLGLINNKDYAMEASSAVNSIATTGILNSTIPSGSVKIGGD